MPKPAWFDWLTVAAIVLGPVLALFAQRVLDRIREKKKQRVGLYLALMSTRAQPLVPAHVQALNSIDVVFNRRWRDRAIRNALATVAGSRGDPRQKAGVGRTTERPEG